MRQASIARSVNTMSCLAPSPIHTASGRPWLSAIAKILVERPPRVRPTQDPLFLTVFEYRQDGLRCAPGLLESKGPPSVSPTSWEARLHSPIFESDDDRSDRAGTCSEGPTMLLPFSAPREPLRVPLWHFSTAVLREGTAFFLPLGEGAQWLATAAGSASPKS